MKRILLLSMVAVLSLAPVEALAAGQSVNVAARESARVTRVALITASATAVGGLADRKNITLQNNGPNPIWCGFTSGVTSSAGSFQILSGATWSADYGTALTVYCIATTANQSSPADTSVVEAS